MLETEIQIYESEPVKLEANHILELFKADATLRSVIGQLHEDATDMNMPDSDILTHLGIIQWAWIEVNGKIED